MLIRCGLRLDKVNVNQEWVQILRWERKLLFNTFVLQIMSDVRVWICKKWRV